MALNTEQNTSTMYKRIRRAFFASRFRVKNFNPVFEHGQWWVIAHPPKTAERDQITYSVNDTDTGFDFEEVKS